MSAEENKIKYWIQEALQTKKCDIEIEGTNAKGGYVGDLYFVKVKLQQPKQDENTLNLIVKTGKTDKGLREKTIFIREVCKREIYFYDKVIPAFKNFQISKNMKDIFDAFPKCYRTFLDDDNEVVVMENLKTQGYEQYPKTKTFNIAHTKLLLENFAKLHALSLATQDQNKEMFDNLTRNYYSNMKELWVFFKPILDANSIKVVENLKKIGREDLADKFEKCFMQKGIFSHLVELANDVPKEKVIVHADCHNGNFLFKYQEKDKSTPTSMALIDFQISILQSPLLDIGFLFYGGLSKNEFAQFDDLMEFYYNELSSFLVRIGSNPEKVFPLSLLWNHWKKYSTYGFLCAVTLLQLLYVVEGSEPSMEGNEHQEYLETFTEMILTSEEEYLERIVAIIEHYFEFQNI